jgi:hypothetical protein
MWDRIQTWVKCTFRITIYFVVCCVLGVIMNLAYSFVVVLEMIFVAGLVFVLSSIINKWYSTLIVPLIIMSLHVAMLFALFDTFLMMKFGYLVIRDRFYTVFGFIYYFSTIFALCVVYRWVFNSPKTREQA